MYCTTGSGAARGIAAIFIGVAVGAASAANVAVSLNPAQAMAWGYALDRTTHGWEFTVNYPIQVTHIGLLDLRTSPVGPGPDGFMIPHDVGLYRTDGMLLASGTMSPGTGDMLLDDFRYVPVEPVTLSPGEHYVVAYYAATCVWPNVDQSISRIPSFQVNPAVNYVVARWIWATGLSFPSTQIDPNYDYPYQFGTNFLFTPEPATLTLLGIVGAALLRRRS